jgi:hypothetical protein
MQAIFSVRKNLEEDVPALQALKNDGALTWASARFARCCPGYNIAGFQPFDSADKDMDGRYKTNQIKPLSRRAKLLDLILREWRWAIPDGDGF